MSTLVGKPLGEVVDAVIELESGRLFQSPINKVWRALILVNRATSPMVSSTPPKLEKVSDALNLHYAHRTTSLAQQTDPWRIKKETFPRTLSGGVVYNEVNSVKDNRKTSEQTKTSLDRIANNIVIYNKSVSPPIAIVIQNTPNVLDVEPRSNWVAVHSMGRNNPFMMYTGGEDKISFEISWYSNNPNNRADVIYKCRLLESWTKADGYQSSPPVLEIEWGGSGLFENDKFILESAPYKLTHFQNACKEHTYAHYDNGQRSTFQPNRVKDLKLYPNYATQVLTFKRVSTGNRTHKEIIGGFTLNTIRNG